MCRQGITFLNIIGHEKTIPFFDSTKKLPKREEHDTNIKKDAEKMHVEQSAQNEKCAAIAILCR